MSEINVVPYIDVMLVLLIIFMITAPLLTQGVKVDLPQAAAKAVDTQDRETLVVTIDRDGRYYLDDRRGTPGGLKRKGPGNLAPRPPPAGGICGGPQCWEWSRRKRTQPLR